MLLQIAYAQVANTLTNLQYSVRNMISIQRIILFLVKGQLGNPDSSLISVVKNTFSVYIGAIWC